MSGRWRKTCEFGQCAPPSSARVGRPRADRLVRTLACTQERRASTRRAALALKEFWRVLVMQNERTMHRRVPCCSNRNFSTGNAPKCAVRKQAGPTKLTTRFPNSRKARLVLLPPLPPEFCELVSAASVRASCRSRTSLSAWLRRPSKHSRSPVAKTARCPPERLLSSPSRASPRVSTPRADVLARLASQAPLCSSSLLFPAAPATPSAVLRPRMPWTWRRRSPI